MAEPNAQTTVLVQLLERMKHGDRQARDELIRAFRAKGQLDTTFGSLGTVTIPGAATAVSNGNLIGDVAVEPDRKIVDYGGQDRTGIVMRA